MNGGTYLRIQFLVDPGRLQRDVNVAQYTDHKIQAQAEKEKLSVIYGPKYTVCVLWVPKGRDFLCFEPMAAVTNAINLSQAGKYKELQSIPPGGEWRESFWVHPTGF